MNRRTFLGSLATLAGTAYLAPHVLSARAPIYGSSACNNLTFKDIPLRFDANCPNNTIYFLSTHGAWKFTDGEVVKL